MCPRRRGRSVEQAPEDFRGAELIKRAQVWKATDVSSKDIKSGPKQRRVPARRDGHVRLRQGATRRQHAEVRVRDSPDDKVKVRFGRANGEIYAGVAATRLLWALGFGADPLYPVHVVCRGCPEEFAAEGDAAPGQIGSISPGSSGRCRARARRAGHGPGWAWPELDRGRGRRRRDSGSPRRAEVARRVPPAHGQQTNNRGCSVSTKARRQRRRVHEAVHDDPRRRH